MARFIGSEESETWDLLLQSACLEEVRRLDFSSNDSNYFVVLRPGAPEPCLYITKETNKSLNKVAPFHTSIRRLVCSALLLTTL